MLLVEDDPDNRRLCAEWLTIAGFRVDEAHNGLQALEHAFQMVPDVVVTDLDIPGIDGFELTRRLKSDPRTFEVPVLAVTGYSAFALDPARARKAGCAAVLAKPYSPDKLADAIRALVDARRRSQTSRMTSQVHIPVPAPPSRRPVVLIVEDHVDTRQMYEEFLSGRFEIVTAGDGREALDVMMAGPLPDLVITDLGLPRLGGFELISEMRQNDGMRRVPVICLSGYGGQAHEKRAQEAGCDRILQKPCLPDVLGDEAEELIRRSRNQDSPA